MYQTRNILIAVSLLILSGCASIDVDTSAPNFNEEKYAEDLDTCRGGSAATAALHGGWIITRRI